MSTEKHIVHSRGFYSIFDTSRSKSKESKGIFTDTDSSVQSPTRATMHVCLHPPLGSWWVDMTRNLGELGVSGHDFVLGTTVSWWSYAGVHFDEKVGYSEVVISRVINDEGCSACRVVAPFMSSSRQVAADSEETLKIFQPESTSMVVNEMSGIVEHNVKRQSDVESIRNIVESSMDPACEHFALSAQKLSRTWNRCILIKIYSWYDLLSWEGHMSTVGRRPFPMDDSLPSRES